MARRLLVSLLTAAVVVPALVAAAPAAASATGQTHGPDHQLERTPTAGVASAAAQPSWCGDLRADDDVENDTGDGTFRYHAIYAYPSDGRSRLRTLASDLQAEAFAASRVLEKSYGRAVRFDMGTRCGPRYLDISHVQLPYTTAELARLGDEGGSKTFYAIAAALRAAGFSTLAGSDPLEQERTVTTNYLVWLDGPGPEACGEGERARDTRRTPDNASNKGGKLAMLYRHGRDFCGHETVLHEIGHNLGALQPEAPNTRDHAHCEDAREDVMCNQTARTATKAVDVFFDYGNDDYWDPPHGKPLPWWTVNLSRFLCDDAACNRSPQVGESQTAGLTTEGNDRPSDTGRRSRGAPRRRGGKTRNGTRTRRNATESRTGGGRG